MLIAGLTGGLASGKSVVAAEFCRLGCHVVEADELGREVMLPGTDVHQAVLSAFATVNRQTLASIVFNDPQQLKRLNAIVHPAVRELSVRRFAQSDKEIGIYVAAILVETGAWRDFARLVVTSCTREQQIERALRRPGASMKDVLLRLATQLPPERRVEVADYVIETGGTMAETARQVAAVYLSLAGDGISTGRSQLNQDKFSL